MNREESMNMNYSTDMRTGCFDAVAAAMDYFYRNSKNIYHCGQSTYNSSMSSLASNWISWQGLTSRQTANVHATYIHAYTQHLILSTLQEREPEN